MNVPALALLTRSLRTEGRSVWTYSSRLALVLVIFIFMMFFSAEAGTMGAPGLEFFQVVVSIDLAFIALAGIGFFATCITEEKDVGTLGLLRMTDLSPVAILLGKLGGRLVAGMLLVLAQLPFTLLAITLGGVSWVQIETAYISLLAFMILVAGLGLLLSVCLRRSRSAVSVMMFLVVFEQLMFAIGFMLRELLIQIGFLITDGRADKRLMEASEALLILNVFYEMNVVALGWSSRLVTNGAIINATVGVACFFLAWLCFDRFNRHDVAAEPPRPWYLRLRKTSGRAPRRVWLGEGAIRWKDFHFIAGGYFGLAVMTAFYVGVTALIAYMIKGNHPEGLLRKDLAGAMLAALFMVGGGHVLILANRIFSEEIQGHTLSTLALLPYPLPRIAYAKISGVLMALAPAVVLVLAAAFVAPDHLAEFLKALFFDDGGPGWVLVCEVVFLVHLVAFLSLYIRWAAVPVAAGINILGFIAFMMTIEMIAFTAPRAYSPIPDGVITLLGCLLLLAAAVALHLGAGWRLARLSRE